MGYRYNCGDGNCHLSSPAFPRNGKSKIENQKSKIEEIVSGGQTGVDRGALDAALSLGIQHGGWCPFGRLAEDGRIPARYRLQETASRDYAERTEQNVVDSDATLILCRGTLSGGTQLTHRLARRHEKPCTIVNLAEDPPVDPVLEWLAGHHIRVLNVAGPRESTNPGIRDAAHDFLTRLLQT